MQTFKSQYIPIFALLLTGLTALWAENHVSYSPTFVVYRYPAAIVIVYVFFRFIAFADKRKTAQLSEVGLLHPLQDSAFFICTHAHFLELGIELGWLSSQASIEIGLLSWASILLGYHAPKEPQGLPNRLIDHLPITTPHNKTTFTQGLILSGSLGIVGTFVAVAQIFWFLIPLGITLLYCHKIKQ